MLATAGMTGIVVMFGAYLFAIGAIDDPRARSGMAIAAIVYTVAAMLFVRRGLDEVAQLEQLSLTDSLSGVPNRRALHLDVRKHARPGEPLALAMVDLDGFKLINDHYGHIIGDRLIKECARLLGEICGEDARFYRLGGDEFAMVAMGPIASNLLESACRRLLERLARPIAIDDRQIAIGASIGLSCSQRGQSLNSTELLRRADVAMYASKAAGKMRCTWFMPQFDRENETSRELENELRQALDGDEFYLHYQPLVDAASARIVAVEALLRWDRGGRAPMGPHQFIPIAENSGLINPIGRWVLKRACVEALGWDEIKLSVNVSAAQLRNPEFPLQLGEVLEETGFPPERLELEITETYLVGDPHVAGRAMDIIRSFGVGVALDDFGTGYASIGFLRKFRFQKLKLDRSLIVEATDDQSSKAMMISSIAVARAMNMDVTAEGVETDAQAAIARVAGCDQIQGWLYYKAMPAADVSALLGAQRLLEEKVA